MEVVREGAGRMSTQLLDARDVARMLKLSPRTVWELTQRGELPAVRLSKRTVRYLLADVCEWIHGHRGKTEK